jgi:hypothetical protein
MTRCFVIETDGTSRIEEVNGYLGFRKIIGGYLEVIQLPVANLCAFVDEQGKICGRKFNPVASMMALAGGFQFNDCDTGIVGPMVIVGRPDENGEETSVPEPMLEKLTRMAQKIRSELKKAPR